MSRYRKTITFEVLSDFDPDSWDERDLLVCLDTEVILLEAKTEVLSPEEMRRLLAKRGRNPNQFEPRK